MMMSSGCHEIWLDPIQGGTWGDAPNPTAPDETEDDVDEPEDDMYVGDPTVHVIAKRGSDVEPGSMPISLDPSWQTPDTLVLIFTNEAHACDEPVIPMQVGVTCDRAHDWYFILKIPPELNEPGLIDLSDARISFRKEIMFPDCGGGGGMGFGHGGTLEIVSNDETSLLVRLSGVGDQHWPIDGEHTVPLCGT
ncbi:hypothetical protein WMF31_22875 [Sorangium sp. So ce1036]|uniref:hypothetical protein n=1 Tax=Sorangium sp. So ce1036 TaxID=3133328 RepID=UPI003F00AFB7